MFKSIRWKFIIIYFLLVFIAMSIIGVFLIREFEDYHLSVIDGNMDEMSNRIITTLNNINWVDNTYRVRDNMTYYEQMGLEIFIIMRDENFTIISSTNSSFINKNAIDILDSELILTSFKGDINSKIINKDENLALSDTKEKSYPIYDDNGLIIGSLYFRRNLEDVYDILNESTMIHIRATIIALFITIILGFFVAKYITTPINDVTIKAKKMAKGDFNQRVDVKSDDEIGQLGKMFNYLTDHLNKVLNEMSSEKQKLDTIINYMADGLIATGINGKIIHVSPKALEMLEVNHGFFIDHLYDDLFEGKNENLMIKNLKMNNKFYGVETIKLREDKVLQGSFAPFMNEKKEIIGIVLLLQDITKHDKLENMRKEFVANVSHELKTPITTIKSYTETLLSSDDFLNDKDLSKKFLGTIDSECDRMTKLVKDLLQLSNIDFQQMSWKKEKFNVIKAVKDSAFKLDLHIKDKNHKINYIMGFKDGTLIELENVDSAILNDLSISGDKDRIEQVFINIISNGIKYTPDGGDIKILFKDLGEDIKISFKDNGVGIPKEDLGRIFERFYRVDKARSRQMGGTGLGLSIAKQIIEAHKGKISIFSEEDQGVEVVIILPKSI